MNAFILASFWQGLAGVSFIIICLLLLFVVLIQKGRGGGLSGAFGGAGGHSAFGAKTGDVFTWITVVLAGLFILVSTGLNYVFLPQKSELPTTPTGVESVEPNQVQTPSAPESAGQAAPTELPAPLPVTE